MAPAPADAAKARPAPGDRLLLRFVSGAVLAPLVLALVWVGGAWFNALIMAAAVLLWREWHRLVAGAAGGVGEVATAASLVGAGVAAASGRHGLAAGVVAASAVIAALLWRRADGRGRWLAGGIVYIGVPAVAAIWLRATPESGRSIVIWLLLTVWAIDIAAYATGRLIGGPKLAPRVSPGKTWAGLAGGVAAAALVGAGAAAAIGGNPAVLVPLGALLAVVEQVGDLAESAVKRRFGVKDSGQLIPGHGGIMDRVDGLLAVLPVVAILVAVNQGLPGWR